MKKILILAVLLLAAVPAVAQVALPISCNLTVASGQSISPMFSVSPTNCAGATSSMRPTPLQIIPPAALDATSYALSFLVCADSTCASTWPLYDRAGNLYTAQIVGGATPTGAVYLDLSVAMGLDYFQIQIVTSGGVAVSQTANRTFTFKLRTIR